MYLTEVKSYESQRHTHCVQEKYIYIYLLQNSGNSDIIWYIVSRINLLQNDVNVFHLTVDYSMWRLLQENVYKIRIIDLDELKQRLRSE